MVLTFKKFNENVDIDTFLLSEKLITFGNKAYPKFNNVVILAGGGGSGKGFTLSNLLGIEGKVFDVDALKTIAMKAPKLNAKIKDQFGVKLSDLNLKNPDDVFKVHTILGNELGIDDKQKQAAFTSIFSSNPDRRPNLIFDVTLKNVNKLRSTSLILQELGYEKENIHIVWVLNSIDVALAQNKKRDRVVPKDILIQTHEGVSLTVKRLLNDVDTLSRYMDGDFWISANLKGVDTEMKVSDKYGDKFPGLKRLT